MNCPICRIPGAEQVAEEVDIGVGTQRFVTGIECPKCGQIPVCGQCGQFNGKHHLWCDHYTKEEKADKKATWIAVIDELPLPGVEVETMIKDPASEYCWCLIRRRCVGGVWWHNVTGAPSDFPPPTHWHPI